MTLDRAKLNVEFPELDFKMKWNLTEDGSNWIIRPKSVNEIVYTYLSRFRS